MSPRTPASINEASTLQKRQDDALPDIAAPRWEWVLDERGIIPATILGVLSYFAPFFTEQGPIWVWIGVGTILVFLWLLIPFAVYIWRGFKAVHARYRQYPIACAYGIQAATELEEEQQRVNEILPYISAFELRHVIYEQTGLDTQDLYIVVAKIKEVHLQMGDHLRVIDETDGRPMGVFRVQRERQDDYFALGLEVDPMWLGSVRQDGRREQYPPMNAVARLMQRSS